MLFGHGLQLSLVTNDIEGSHGQGAAVDWTPEILTRSYGYGVLL